MVIKPDRLSGFAAGISKRYWFAPTIAGIGAAGLSLWSTGPYGIGVSPDSIAYISTARNLATGNGLIGYDGLPFVAWPPLYPLILSAFEYVGIDSLAAARIVAAVFWGLTLTLVTAWMRRHIQDSLLIWIGTLSMLFAEPLLLVNTYAWTDGIFVVWVICFLWHLERFLSDRSRQGLVWAALFAALACLTRFVGVTLLATGAILLLTQGQVRIPARLRRAISFTILSALPVGMWMWRSYVLSGSLTGPRFSTESSVVRALGHAIGTFAEWFLPSMVGIALYVVITRGNRHVPVSQDRGNHVVGVGLTFAILYTVFLIAAESLIGHVKVGHRLLVPVFPTLLLLLLRKLDWRRRVETKAITRPAQYLAVASLALWILWPVTETLITIREYRTVGVGAFTARAWHESELIRTLAELPPTESVRSNAPDAIYLWLGRDASFVPFSDLSRTLYRDRFSLETFVETLSTSGPVYIAWFDAVHRSYLFSIPQLRGVCALDPIVECADGTLFQAKTMTAPDAVTSP